MIRLPEWLGGDWSKAAGLAAGALFAGFIVHYVLALGFLVVLQLVAEFVTIDWGATLRGPITTYLTLQGPVDGIGLWLTGLVWIWLGFRIASTQIGGWPRSADEGGAGLWIFGAKVGLIYAVVIAVLAAIFEPDPLPTGGSAGVSGAFPGSGLGFAEWEIALAFFLSLLAAVGMTVFVRIRMTGRPFSSLFGIEQISVPRQLSAAWGGAVRATVVALSGLAVLLLIGSLLDFADIDAGFRSLAAFFLTLLLFGFLLAAIDVALVFMMASMRFFVGDSYGFGFDTEFWVWGGVAIVAIAFVLGGIRAAERLAPQTAASAIGVGALVGPCVGLILFVMTWFVIGTGEQIVGPALGLPILWSVASGFGGAIYANQNGLMSGIRIETTG